MPKARRPANCDASIRDLMVKEPATLESVEDVRRSQGYEESGNAVFPDPKKRTIYRIEQLREEEEYTPLSWSGEEDINVESVSSISRKRRAEEDLEHDKYHFKKIKEYDTFKDLKELMNIHFPKPN